MFSRSIIFILASLFILPTNSIAKECIPVLKVSLTKSGNTDLSMNDEFNSVMTTMIPLFVCLDVTLQTVQDEDLAQAVDDSGARSFSVKGIDGDTEYDLDLKGHPLATWYSQESKRLTGYSEIYNMEGPYQGSMVVAMRPFTPTLHKCMAETSGQHAFH